MDTETKNALEESINHWMHIYNGVDLLRHHYVEQCALCGIFYQTGLHPYARCTGCPLVSTNRCCIGPLETPWLLFKEYYTSLEIPRDATMDDLEGATRQKMRFFALLMVKTLERCREL